MDDCDAYSYTRYGTPDHVYFCNYDYGGTGFCERCGTLKSEWDCQYENFITERGKDECKFVCPYGGKKNYCSEFQSRRLEEDPIAPKPDADFGEPSPSRRDEPAVAGRIEPVVAGRNEPAVRRDEPVGSSTGSGSGGDDFSDEEMPADIFDESVSLTDIDRRVIQHFVEAYWEEARHLREELGSARDDSNGREQREEESTLRGQLPDREEPRRGEQQSRRRLTTGFTIADGRAICIPPVFHPEYHQRLQCPDHVRTFVTTLLNNARWRKNNRDTYMQYGGRYGTPGWKSYPRTYRKDYKNPMQIQGFNALNEATKTAIRRATVQAHQWIVTNRSPRAGEYDWLNAMRIIIIGQFTFLVQHIARNQFRLIGRLRLNEYGDVILFD